MNKGRDYLSIRDLMKLMGTKHYNSAQRKHKAIRDAIKPGKKNLSIAEYCKWEGENENLIRFGLKK